MEVPLWWCDWSDYYQVAVGAAIQPMLACKKMYVKHSDDDEDDIHLYLYIIYNSLMYS